MGRAGEGGESCTPESGGFSHSRARRVRGHSRDVGLGFGVVLCGAGGWAPTWDVG